jgi:NAD-dependent dihydropyrimidine dehydrogenase PreA subunit
MMTTDVYQKLREHLDDLPGGYPATETGVELRILKRMFTPEEAWLATHLTLIAEEPRVVARRAKIGQDEAARRLEGMARKGLLFRIEEEPGKPTYMAAQYVIGMWEYHVNDLDPEFIADMEEYKPYLNFTVWAQPQLRTIPVGQSIDNSLEVMTYERAEELIADHDRFAIAPCICRREKKMIGKGCDRPEANCLTFGIGADYYIKNELGRPADKQEILDALKAANDHALVLQPGNSKEIVNICCCCGCCCGVLTSLKQLPAPADYVSSPFTVEADAAKCEGCETCVDRCQMDALSMADEKVLLNSDRCIGCGLCVTTCPSGALTLKRKPEEKQPKVPNDRVAAAISHGQARGKIDMVELLKLQGR